MCASTSPDCFDAASASSTKLWPSRTASVLLRGRDRLRVVGHHRQQHDLARRDVVDRDAEAGLDLRADVDDVERVERFCRQRAGLVGIGEQLLDLVIVVVAHGIS